jgi:hypothetical protein
MNRSSHSMLTPWRRHVIALLLSVMAMGTTVGATDPAKPPASRLDAFLRAAAEAPSRTSQRVIIRVRTGSRDDVRRAVIDSGDEVLTEIASLVIAVVRSDRLLALAGREDVLTMSTDGKVAAVAQPIR